ncbi:MAG: hypothetical protein ACM3JD_00065, partial [Rudaea sp.]
MPTDPVLTLLLIVVPLTALVLALVLTPLTIRLATRLGFLDRPAPRRLHSAPTPRHGGVALYFAFLIPLALTIPFPRSDPNEAGKLIALALGMTVIAVAGAYDDARELKPLPQFGFQFLAAAIAIVGGVVIDRLPNPLGTDIEL